MQPLSFIGRKVSRAGSILKLAEITVPTFSKFEQISLSYASGTVNFVTSWNLPSKNEKNQDYKQGPGSFIIELSEFAKYTHWNIAWDRAKDCSCNSKQKVLVRKKSIKKQLQKLIKELDGDMYDPTAGCKYAVYDLIDALKSSSNKDTIRLVEIAKTLHALNSNA